MRNLSNLTQHDIFGNIHVRACSGHSPGKCNEIKFPIFQSIFPSPGKGTSITFLSVSRLCLGKVGLKVPFSRTAPT